MSKERIPGAGVAALIGSLVAVGGCRRAQIPNDALPTTGPVVSEDAQQTAPPAATEPDAGTPIAPSGLGSVVSPGTAGTWADPPRHPERLKLVSRGMSQAQVVATIGRPDEIRTEREGESWLVEAKELWAYGTVERGGFAFGGLVLIGHDGWVKGTLSPMDDLPVCEAAAPALSCDFRGGSAGPTGFTGQVTVRNGAPVPYTSPGPAGLKFRLVAEVWTEDGRLLARESTGKYYSPYSDSDAITIPAGGSDRTEIGIGWEWSFLGAFPRGRYRVRVAFPAGNRRCAVSGFEVMTVR